MSKLETVRALSDSNPQQLQIVQSIQQLQQSINELRSLPELLARQTAQTLEPLRQLPQETASSTKAALAPLQEVRRQIEQMQREMATLPSAVASETAKALEVLVTLKQDVSRVLNAYDQVMERQRQSLDSLASEMTNRAAEAFESKTQKLSKPLGDLRDKAADLSMIISRIDSLPGRLSAATDSLETACENLIRAAISLRPPLWKRLETLLLVAVLAGVVAALLVGTGQAVSARLVPKSDVQKMANLGNAILSKATQQEHELIQQIVNRPAK